MKVLWDRPITKASRLLGVDDRAVFLGGAELSAMDLQDAGAALGDAAAGRQHGASRPGAARRASGSSRRGGSTRSTRPRATCGGSSAARTRASAGGDLLLTDRWLLAISNRTISAYPRRAAGAGLAASARVGPATTKEKASP